MGYSPHDHRFLSALAKTEHKIYFVQLEKADNSHLPAEIDLVDWEGGARDFRWRDVPSYARGMKRILAKIQPDLLHAGPIQRVGLIAVLSKFKPLLMMSWGFDLIEDVHRNLWWKYITQYVLRNSTFFISDAQVTRNEAIKYGMNPENTIVFPWGVDLDHFKQVNDTYGHKAGDIVLQETVKRFRNVLRGNKEDKIIRYGGDEFILILTNVRENYLESILNRIIKAINEKVFKYEKYEIKLTISIGASFFYEADSPDKLLTLTDKRLYVSKDKGRNCFTIDGDFT